MKREEGRRSCETDYTQPIASAFMRLTYINDASTDEFNNIYDATTDPLNIQSADSLTVPPNNPTTKPSNNPTTHYLPTHQTTQPLTEAPTLRTTHRQPMHQPMNRTTPIGQHNRTIHRPASHRPIKRCSATHRTSQRPSHKLNKNSVSHDRPQSPRYHPS